MKISVAVASMIRLKVYCGTAGQNDFVETNESLISFQTSPFHEIKKAVGCEAALNYLITMFHIQRKIIYGYATDTQLLERRFRFMHDLRLHQQIVNEWKNIQTDNTYILRITIQAMSALRLHDDVITCCNKLITTDATDEDYVRHRYWAAGFLTYINQYKTHIIAADYLREAVNVIERNQQFQQLAEN